jgi:hypothetical protein
MYEAKSESPVKKDKPVKKNKPIIAVDIAPPPILSQMIPASIKNF